MTFAERVRLDRAALRGLRATVQKLDTTVTKLRKEILRLISRKTMLDIDDLNKVYQLYKDVSSLDSQTARALADVATVIKSS